MRLTLKFWVSLCLASLVIVPAGVFLGGLLLAGPYEGNNGLFSLAGELYRDAIALRPAALLLLGSPLLLAGIWALALMLHRSITPRPGAEADS